MSDIPQELWDEIDKAIEKSIREKPAQRQPTLEEWLAVETTAIIRECQKIKNEPRKLKHDPTTDTYK